MFADCAHVNRLSATRVHRPLRAKLATYALAATLLGAAVGSPRAALADASKAASHCNVTGIHVAQTDGHHEVRIHTDCEPAFTTLRLTSPSRVAVDLAHGQVGRLAGTLPVEDGAITQVVLQQVGAGAAPVGRVLVGLEDDVAHEVVRDGHDIVLRTLSAAEAAATSPGRAQASRAFVPLAAGADKADKADKPASSPVSPPKARALKLTAMRAHAGGALLQLGGTPTFRATHLTHPPRLVVDVAAATPRSAKVRMRGRLPWLQRIRLGRTPAGEPAGMRVVFDLTGPHAPEVLARPNGLWIGPRPRAAASSRAANEATSQVGAAPTAALRLGKLTALRCEHAVVQGKSQTRIVLTTTGDVSAEVDQTNPRAWILRLGGAELPDNLEQTLDTRSRPGVVSLLSAFQAQRDPAQVHVVASLTGRASGHLARTPQGWVWQIDDLDAAAAPAPAFQPATPPALAKASRAFPRTAGFSADAPSPANNLRNHRISLDVKDADIINVLRLISEETGENIIASDEVKGKITLKLRNVPAEQALDTVLRIKGYDRVRYNNILRIASAESIQKERDLEVARKRALIEVEEVGIKMLTINYANAGEVVEQLKPMLSARGSLQVDQRTNTLILQDVASNVDRLTELALRLDKQTPLVNIQARIVEATSSFARDLGVQWGGASQHTARTGNPTGVYFPADVTASGAADLTVANQTGGVVNPARYAVNFPALLSGQGAGLGFVLGSAGGAQLLDLRLSAMESNGNGKIISSPEVSTLDNKIARVSQGIEIPVSTVSAAGTNTRFIPAVLQLEVTPHVTNDGTVLMKIHVEKSAPDFTQKGGQGDPTINKRQADTEVLVRDGDTSVIGGILTRETTDARSEVPFLARIPILGNLFRRHQSAENRAELLVFITPRIINREASTVQAGSVFDRTNN